MAHRKESFSQSSKMKVQNFYFTLRSKELTQMTRSTLHIFMQSKPTKVYHFFFFSWIMIPGTMFHQSIGEEKIGFYQKWAHCKSYAFRLHDEMQKSNKGSTSNPRYFALCVWIELCRVITFSWERLFEPYNYLEMKSRQTFFVTVPKFSHVFDY